MARLRPTLADYVVIAISPVLIMALVGSLVFFLLEVFYQGQYGERMTFIMAMFVMATVLIGRISIEEGREYAAMFAIPLGIVTFIAVFRFVEFRGALAGFSSIINIGMIALIWWSADRLTWDCTVIDESKDATGEGLLQTVGLDEDPAVQESTGTETTDEFEGTTDRRAPQPSGGLWQRFISSRRRPHPHGVWVIYFSLAALPLFGIGQWFIRADDLASRRYVFHLAVAYVAAALGLLVTTSFLGLRRYLRQRRLEMPTEMAGVWIGTGAAMIVALLVLCLILPRRNAEYSITHLPAFAGSPDDLQTSDWGFGSDGPEQEDADRQVTRDDAEQTRDGDQGKESGGKQDSSQAKGGQSKGGKQGEAGKDRSDGESGGEKSSQQSDNQDAAQSQSEQDQQQDDSDGQQNGRKKGGRDGSEAERKNGSKRKSKTDSESRNKSPGKSGESKQSSDETDESERNAQSREGEQESQDQKQSSSSPSSPNRSFSPSKLLSQLGAGIGSLLKLVYWLIVIAIVGYLVWRYHAQIREAIRNFITAMREFWERLFGGGAAETEAAEEAAAASREPPPRPFADFDDPFVSGAAGGWSMDQLIKYSFEAFEAWARERGCQRVPEQTPYEFAVSVSSREAELGRNALRLAELYNLSAYAQRSAPPSAASHIQRLWEALRR